MTSQDGNHRTRVGRERRQRTGLKLLQAVFEAIDDEGLERLSVDRIRATARLSRGSFYNYASTLDDLLATVTDLIWRQVHSEQAALFDVIPDPIERRCCYLRYGVGRSTSDKACGLVLLRSLPRTGTFSREMRLRMLADFSAAHASGAIDVSSVETAVDLGMGLTVSMLREAVLNGPNAATISEQSVMVMRALGVPKDRASEIAGRPLPDPPAVPLRAKVLATGWI